MPAAWTRARTSPKEPRHEPSRQGRARPRRHRHHARQRGLEAHPLQGPEADRKSTRLNSSHLVISYAVFCLKKKKKKYIDVKSLIYLRHPIYHDDTSHM